MGAAVRACVYDVMGGGGGGYHCVELHRHIGPLITACPLSCEG